MTDCFAAKTARLAVLAMACAALLIAACAQRPKPDTERFSNNQRVDGGDFPDADGVILLDRTEVSFFPPTGKSEVVAEVVHTQRIQIATAKGLGLARMVLPFDSRTRFVSVQGKVIHPDGSSAAMHENAMVDVDRFKDGTAAARLYDGKGYKAIKVGDVQIGDVIELVTLALVRDPRWLPPVSVGAEIVLAGAEGSSAIMRLPYVRGEVVVNIPKGFDVDTRITRHGRLVQNVLPVKIPTRVGSLTQNVSVDDGIAGQRLAFVFDREPALFPEGAAPQSSALCTQVHVQLLRYQPDRGGEGVGFRSFDDVARWYRELTFHLDQPTDYAKNLVKPIARGSKADRLKAVQRYVQDEIGDVPTFLHLAALPVHSGDDVARVKVGDSIDQANLTLSMLRSMGVDGFAVLVSRAGSFASVPDLATPAPFNHVVIAVPQGGSYAWIDPSTPGLPTGRLPGALQGQKGVLVRPDRGVLIDLPEDQPDDNVTTVELELVQDGAGGITGVCKATLMGVDAALARGYLLQASTAAAQLQKLLLGDDSGAPDVLTKIVLQDPTRISTGPTDDVDAPLKLELRVVPLKAVDDVHPLDLVPERYVGRPLAFLWRDGRKAPVVLDHRGIVKVKLSVKMPEGKGVQELPASLAKSGSILTVDEQWAVADGAFWLSRTLKVQERIVPVERYDELRAAAASLWSRQQQVVHVVDGGDRGAAYNGDPF